MTIEEAIKHCEEVAEVNHKMVESLVGIDTDEQERCRECAKDHEQLAEWLKELKAVENLPSVTPQQRTGRWIEVIDETDSLGNKTWHHECSICGSDKSGWGTYKHCPDCGTKMEVEE